MVKQKSIIIIIIVLLATSSFLVWGGTFQIWNLVVGAISICSAPRDRAGAADLTTIVENKQRETEQLSVTCKTNTGRGLSGVVTRDTLVTDGKVHSVR